MSKISIESAVVTVTLNDVRYVHDFVTNIEITDPRETALTVSPQGGGTGLAYGLNLTQPIALSLTARSLQPELVDLYKSAFKNKTRIDFMIYDDFVKERYDINSAILKTSILNAKIAEGDGALDVLIEATAPPASFNHSTAQA